jgi:hypothetical protein
MRKVLDSRGVKSPTRIFGPSRFGVIRRTSSSSVESPGFPKLLANLSLSCSDTEPSLPKVMRGEAGILGFWTGSG